MEPYELLEREIAEWSGMPHVVCCSSGTVALHLALESLQLPQGSTVLMPDFSMIACPRATSLAGLEPAFVDCDDRLLMCDRHFSVDVLGSRTGKYVSAIMVVHIYGRQQEMDAVNSFACCAEDIVIIEDLAEAHGVKPHWGTDAACWSFYKNKIIAGEEGGAVGFRDPKHAALARQLRSLGFTEEHDFTHVPRGCNYRLSNANARLILYNFRSALDVATESENGADYLNAREWDKENPFGLQYEYLIAQRLQNVLYYDELCPNEWKMPPRDAPWIYDLRIPGMMPLRQAELVRALQAKGIAARHAFRPMSQQAEYRHCPVYGSGNAAVASREVIYLPLDPGKVTEASCERAFKVIRRVVGQR